MEEKRNEKILSKVFKKGLVYITRARTHTHTHTHTHHVHRACGVEEKRNESILSKVLKKQREGRFRATLGMLAKLCARLELVFI
jgi:hypothetical protein